MSMIRAEYLTFSYPESYDNIFEDACFQIDTDWKLGFVGRNGRGKTTLLKLLLGEYEYGGKITSSVQFDYFPYPVADKKQVDGGDSAGDLSCGGGMGADAGTVLSRRQCGRAVAEL